jgi:N-acetylglucosamine-6-phosphate deacetylase
MAPVPGSVVRAATVLTPEGPLSPGEVVVEGGLIVEVRSATGATSHWILAPGFIDLQMNGIGAVDVAVAGTGAGTGNRDGDWEMLDRALLAQGVTTWCPTLVSAPRAEMEASLARINAAAARPTERRPAIAGAHLEGPFLAVAGAHPPAHLEASVDRAWLAGLGGVAVVTLAPELPGALEAIEGLVAAGVLVAVGHSACSVEVAGAAADAGARLVTHLGNAMGPFRPREPGLLGAALTDDRLAVSLIADLVHVHPLFLTMAFRAKGAGGTVLVTDAVATGHSPGDNSPTGSPENGPPRMADGTLVGSVLRMERAVGNCVEEAGIGLAEAVAAASSTPARLLGLGDRGAISPGRRADLVALGPGLGVERVWVGGEVALTGPS